MKDPVLILGWIPRIVVTIARSLHRHGIPVDVADCVGVVRIRSMAVRKSIRLPYPNDAPHQFRKALLALLEQGRYSLLLPGDDLAMAAILEHYEEIRQFVRIACPPPEITQNVLIKDRTLRVAAQLGIRIPRTVKASHTRDLREIAQEISFPWILKPSAKEKRFEEFTSRRFDSLEDVAQAYPLAESLDPPMLVQEFCEGVGVGVQALLHKGKCLALFQHRRLKELPYTGGVAVTAIAETPDPALVRTSLTLLESLQWDGVAMVEFRVNPKTGEAVLMEVNGRFWGTLSLAVSAGMDFPLYYWQILHGETPSIPSSAGSGLRWRWTVGYISRLYRLAAVARYSSDARQELWKTLSEVPSDFSPRVAAAIFRLSDPLPAVLEFCRAIQFYSWHAAIALYRSMPSTSKSSPGEKATKA